MTKTSLEAPFKSDLSYSDQEKNKIESLMFEDNKAKLKELKYYILNEIGNQNISFLRKLSLEKKKKMLDVTDKMNTTAKKAFEQYTKRIWFTDYKKRDDKKIWSIDPGFWVAVSQALIIHCCDQEQNLNTWVLKRAKSPWAVDGRFWPNTLFAMNAIFKEPWYFGKNEKFNGLLEDGANGTTLLDKIIWIDTEKGNYEDLWKIINERTDYKSDGKLSTEVKTLLTKENTVWLGEYIRSQRKNGDKEANTTTNLYIQRELLSILADKEIRKDMTATKEAFIKELKSYWKGKENPIAQALDKLSTQSTVKTPETKADKSADSTITTNQKKTVTPSKPVKKEEKKKWDNNTEKTSTKQPTNKNNTTKSDTTTVTVDDDGTGWAV